MGFRVEDLPGEQEHELFGHSELLPDALEVLPVDVELPDAYEEAVPTAAQVEAAWEQQVVDLADRRERVSAVLDEIEGEVAEALEPGNKEEARREKPFAWARNLPGFFGYGERKNHFAVNPWDRRDERSYAFGHIDHDLQTENLGRTSLRNSRLRRNAADRLQSVIDKVPGAARDAVESAMGTAQDIYGRVITASRRRLHLSTNTMQQQATEESARAVVTELHASGELDEAIDDRLDKQQPLEEELEAA